MQPKAQTQPSSHKTAKAGDFLDPPMASERRGPRRFGYGPGFSTSSDSPPRADVIAFVPVVPADGTSKSN